MGHEVLTAKTIRNRRDKSRLDGFRAAVLEEVSILTRPVEKSNPESRLILRVSCTTESNFETNRVDDAAKPFAARGGAKENTMGPIPDRSER